MALALLVSWCAFTLREYLFNAHHAPPLPPSGSMKWKQTKRPNSVDFNFCMLLGSPHCCPISEHSYARARMVFFFFFGWTLDFNFLSVQSILSWNSITWRFGLGLLLVLLRLLLNFFFLLPTKLPLPKGKRGYLQIRPLNSVSISWQCDLTFK